MLFSDVDFSNRFSLAQKSGVEAAEFWRWGNKDLTEVKAKMKENGLSFAVCNLDSKNEQLSGELLRGILNKGRKEDFLSAINESIPAYRELGANALIVLIGETLEIPYDEQIKNITDCLLAAVPLLEKENINLVVEPLNDIDRKNYFLPRSKEVFEIVRKIGSKHIKVLLDLYHEQLMAGNLINTVKENIDFIGHIHIADVPGRHEPGTGEINYVNILRTLKELDYENYVGFEFRSTKDAEQTAKIIKEYLL